MNTQPLDVVETTRKLIALFDAAANLPGSNTHQLHDYDGAIVKTLKLWARDRGLEVGHRRMDLIDSDRPRSWDAFEVTFRPGSYIVVHDATSYQYREVEVENVGGDWSPAQAVAS